MSTGTRLRPGPKSALVTLTGAAVGLMLCVGLAVPAQASTVSTDDSPAIPPAVQTWLDDSTTAASRLPASASDGDPTAGDSTQSVKVKVETAGERIESYRGSPLLWTGNWFEWYWTTKKVTTSKAWQTVGFVFPNTAKADGVAKTYTSATKHEWRSKNTVGAGVVTPWGNVDVYETDYATYATLRIGGLFSVK